MHKKINDVEIDNAQNTDTVMPMYNLIEYSDNYSKDMEVYWNTTNMNQMIT